MGVTSPAPAPRPPYRDPALLGLIALGGALGTLARAGLANALPTASGGWPWATFAVNVAGALALGFLLELLARLGPDAGVRRAVRLGVGTGFMGGFTTYSTFAVEVASALPGPGRLLGIAYGVATVLLGFGAAALGILAARRLARAEGVR